MTSAAENNWREGKAVAGGWSWGSTVARWGHHPPHLTVEVFWQMPFSAMTSSLSCGRGWQPNFNQSQKSSVRTLSPAFDSLLVSNSHAVIHNDGGWEAHDVRYRHEREELGQVHKEFWSHSGEFMDKSSSHCFHGLQLFLGSLRLGKKIDGTKTDVGSNRSSVIHSQSIAHIAWQHLLYMSDRTVIPPWMEWKP